MLSRFAKVDYLSKAGLQKNSFHQNNFAKTLNTFYSQPNLQKRFVSSHQITHDHKDDHHNQQDSHSHHDEHHHVTRTPTRAQEYSHKFNKWIDESYFIQIAGGVLACLAVLNAFYAFPQEDGAPKELGDTMKALRNQPELMSLLGSSIRPVEQIKYEKMNGGYWLVSFKVRGNIGEGICQTIIQLPWFSSTKTHATSFTINGNKYLIKDEGTLELVQEN